MHILIDVLSAPEDEPQGEKGLEDGGSGHQGYEGRWCKEEIEPAKKGQFVSPWVLTFGVND